MPNYAENLQEHYKNVRERLGMRKRTLLRIPRGVPRPIRGRLASGPWPVGGRITCNYHVWFQIEVQNIATFNTCSPSEHLRNLACDGYLFDLCGRYLISPAEFFTSHAKTRSVTHARQEMMWFLHRVKLWQLCDVADFMRLKDTKGCMLGIRRHQQRVEKELERGKESAQDKSGSAASANVRDGCQPAY